MELKHTWVFSRDSRIIRFYLWAWRTDVHQITFCKLFWAYIFALPNLLLRGVWAVLWPIRKALGATGRKINAIDKKVQARREREFERKAPAILKGEQPDTEAPAKIAEFFADPKVRRAAKVGGYAVLIPSGLLVALALVFGLVWLVPHVPDAIAVAAEASVYWFLHTDAWQVAAIIVGIVAVSGSAVFLTEHFQLEQRAKERKRRKHEAGEPTLGDVLVQGAKAVKTNTCPRIEVRRGR